MSKLKVPFVYEQSSRGLLFVKFGNVKLRFGDLYYFDYRPKGSRLPRERQISKLPFYDLHPLILFLEYRPSEKTILAINLHHVDPKYRMQLFFMLDYIKELLHLKVTEEGKKLEPEDTLHMSDIFESEEDNIERLEETEKKLIDEDIDEKALIMAEKLLKGKKAIDWSMLLDMNHPLYNILPVCFRVYRLSLLKNIDDLHSMDDDEREDKISETSIIHGKIPWKMFNIKHITKLAKDRKDWKSYIKRIVKKYKKEENKKL